MFNQFLVQPFPTPQINFCLEEYFGILMLLFRLNINNKDQTPLDSPSRRNFSWKSNLTFKEPWEADNFDETVGDK